MDQKIISNGGVVTGVLLIVVGIIVLPVAIGLMASYPHELWPYGVVLVGCSAVILVGAVKSLRKSGRRLRTLDVQVKAIREAATAPAIRNPASPAPAAVQNDVLVKWQYQPEEWKRFYEWESGERKSNNIIVAILVSILGTFFIRYTRESTWGVAMAVSALVGVAYAALAYFFAMASLGRAKNAVVIITGDAVLINDKLNVFRDEDRRLSDVKILEEMDPKVFELTYEFRTARGKSDEQIRVPIPKGKLGEAVLLMGRLQGGGN